VKISNFLIILILIHIGCQFQTERPKLSPDYLQLITSEIKKIDSGAKVLKFIPDTGKFEFLDKVISNGYFEIGSIKINGNAIETIEYDSVFKDSRKFEKRNITNYTLSNQRVIEKRLIDLKEDRIYRIKYNKALIYEIVTNYKKEHDLVTTRFEYDNDKLIRKRLFSKEENVFWSNDLIYKNDGNLDYTYITDKEEGNEFEKYEFNNKLKQLIVSRFDKNKNLLWMRYSEYNNKGLITYEERYNKRNRNLVFRKDIFTFNQNEEIISLEAKWPLTKLLSKFEFQYLKRDSLNNWTERITFEDDKPFLITKRAIKYAEKK